MEIQLRFGQVSGKLHSTIGATVPVLLIDLVVHALYSLTNSIVACIPRNLFKGDMAYSKDLTRDTNREGTGDLYCIPPDNKNLKGVWSL